jgi:sugar O-acyltransferase (sialic acid O-acetyltransferase NeuD family)
MSAERIAVLGAGGHGAVVIAALQASGRTVVACFDDSPLLEGTDVLGVPVLGPMFEASRSDCTHAICAIGDNTSRRLVVDQLDLPWATVIHPFTWVHPEAEVGLGTFVAAGTIVQPGAIIGSHVILNTKSCVDHHTSVGDYAHLAGASLAGGASVGEGAFLGAASVVIPRVHVGEWSMVGAGAVVTKHVPPGVTVAGVPARRVPKMARTARTNVSR